MRTRFVFVPIRKENKKICDYLLNIYNNQKIINLPTEQVLDLN